MRFTPSRGPFINFRCASVTLECQAIKIDESLDDYVKAHFLLIIKSDQAERLSFDSYTGS